MDDEKAQEGDEQRDDGPPETPQVEPHVDEADSDDPPREQSQAADQESKHSYPTSDPPANY